MIKNLTLTPLTFPPPNSSYRCSLWLLITWDGYVLLMSATLGGWFHWVWAGRVVIILILTSLRLILQLLFPHWQPSGVWICQKFGLPESW